MLNPSDIITLANLRRINASMVRRCALPDAPPAVMTLQALVGGAAEGALDVLSRRAVYDAIQEIADQIAGNLLDEISAAMAQEARKPK